MLHESRHLPVWYFPEEDVRMDLLCETRRTTHCPGKGDTRYYAIGDVEKAAWTYPEPIAGMEGLRGLVAFHFGALDEWLEEDEPVVGHPRDPFHRIDMDLLQPSETRTTCAYKGRASTFSSGAHHDVAWTYPEPEREVGPIRDRIAFYDEFVDIELDGEPQERPLSPFSCRS